MKIETDTINILEINELELNVIKNILENTTDFKESNLRNIDETDPNSIIDILNINQKIDKTFQSILSKINNNNILNLLPDEFAILKKGIEFKYNKDVYRIDIAANNIVRKDLLNMIVPIETIYYKFNLGLDNFS